MSEELFEDTNLSRYEVIAWANEQDVVYYKEFGGYQGEWILISRDKENYFIYKGWYDSCDGCDNFGGANIKTKEDAKNFAEYYPPFLVIPKETMMNLCKNRTLLSVFPENIRDECFQIDLKETANDTIVAVKLLENLDIELNDILQCRNAEIKQKALKKFTYERFVNEAKPEIIDKDERGQQLFRLEDIVLLYLKDYSTDRKYLLRVPPEMKKVKQAIAWTFNKEEEDYNPIIET
jgi:hypothetical protein